MADPSGFNQEVHFRTHYQLDGAHVLAVERTHGADNTVSAPSRGEDEGHARHFVGELTELFVKDKRFRRTEDAAAGVSKRAVRRLPSIAASSCYAYCVVMPRAERTLAAALQHEHFAGEDWAKIRLVAAHLAEALSEMHERGLLHGDFKPLNAVRHDGRWRLIDLDCACALGAPFGTKQPSTGYCPPEMARVIRAAERNGASLGSAAMQAALATYSAAAAYDMWSLGVVLYQLFTTGKPLFLRDQNDDVEGPELDRLCDWSASTRTRVLGAKLRRSVGEAAHDLLFKLLDPDPACRAAYFDGAVDGIMMHPFFMHGTDLGAQAVAELKKLNHNVSCVERRLGSIEGKVDEIATKLDQILSQLKTQSRMTRELLSKEHALPTYVVLLPKAGRRVGQTGGGGLSASVAAVKRAIDNPGSIFNDTLVVHFVDPVSLQFANTNGGHGFELTHPKRWVAKAAPYLSMGLAVLSTAAAVGRVAGFPVPNVAGTAKRYLDSSARQLAHLSGETTTVLANALHLDPDVVAQELDALTMDDMEHHEADSSERLDVRRKAVGFAAMQLCALLDATHEGWVDRCGLVRVTSPRDGYTEWVLPEHASRFQEEGIAALGAATESGEERAARAEAELKSLRHSSPGTPGMNMDTSTPVHVGAAEARSQSARKNRFRFF